MVGSNLLERLLLKGAKVRATLHTKAAVVLDERIEYMEVDLTNPEHCRHAVADQRFVFMCAASTSGAAAIVATPMIHVTPNVIMNSLMLEAAHAAGVEKFLWLSSSVVYPPSGYRPVNEEDSLNNEPYDAYYFSGWSKRFTEILCRMYGEKLADPMTTIVIRPSNVYGPKDDFEPTTSHVTAALIRKVAEKQVPIEIWGSGDDVRDVIYVGDMVDGLVRAVEILDHPATVNIALGQTYSVKEILRTLLELAGYEDATVVFDCSKPSMIPVRIIDTAKA